MGLGYIKLGQPATTLSGGEAQRVKLSTELSKRSTGRTLYLLDEPTTGLSFPDVAALLRVLQRLVDGGNTVLVIEHHLDVIKNADHVIDLGPLGGDRGGELVATGPPEEVAAHPTSHTGRFLRETLAKHGREIRPAAPARNGRRARKRDAGRGKASRQRRGVAAGTAAASRRSPQRRPSRVGDGERRGRAVKVARARPDGRAAAFGHRPGGVALTERALYKGCGAGNG